MKKFAFGILLLTNLGLTAFPAAAETALKVVTSINPVHSLVAAIMQGVGTPTLIIKNASSPHSYSMKPSQLEALHSADVVFWIGEHMESVLYKPIISAPGKTRISTLSKVPGLKLYEGREGGAWSAPDGDHHHDHSSKHHEDETDMHLWLDPENAKILLHSIAETMVEIDPKHQKVYTANRDNAAAKLDILSRDIRQLLQPVLRTPYIVFHDAFQYFEKRFGTNAVGAISINPERSPGAKRLYEIRRKIMSAKARCVFSEPQFQPKLVTTVLEGTDAKAGELDPLGANIKSGSDAYGSILLGMAKSLRACLEDTR